MEDLEKRNTKKDKKKERKKYPYRVGGGDRTKKPIKEGP